MENLAHTLCGALLAKTRLGRLSPLAPVSLLIGANLPDVDLVASLFGGDDATRKASYLLHHRGITHSLLGIAVEALLLAAAIRWIERREIDGDGQRAPRRPWRAHLLPAFAALLTHPLLDLLNDYGVRPWLPFSQARYFGDLVFIVDPWLWLLLGGTAALAGPRTRIGHGVWSVIAGATTTLLWFHPRTPEFVRVAYPIAVALLAAARAAGIGRERAGRVVASGGVLVAAYLALLAWCGATAVARVKETPALAAQFQMRTPSIADPTRWSIALRDGATVRWEQVGLDGRPVAGEVRSARGGRATVVSQLDDPRAQLAAAKPEAAAWRSFARLPWAWIEEEADGGAQVHLADARYETEREPESWCVIIVALTPAEVAATR
jgi:inner membrane protein